MGLSLLGAAGGDGGLDLDVGCTASGCSCGRRCRSRVAGGAGGVFDGGFDFDELRSSAGIAMEIPTPISPIVVGYALPLQEKEGDATQKFFFTMSGL